MPNITQTNITIVYPQLIIGLNLFVYDNLIIRSKLF